MRRQTRRSWRRRQTMFRRGLSLAVSRFCLNDRHAAGEMFESLRESFSGHTFETVNFSPTFYDNLRRFSADDLTRGLPPLLNLTDLPSDSGGVLYLSCNFFYFRAFALPMICSLRHKSPHTPVHLHIMDASESEAKFAIDFCTLLKLPRFAVSVERPGLQSAKQMEARCYYHAVRFIRLYQHIQAYRCPLWLMDVDAIVNRDLSELFAMLGDNDAAMRVRPGRIEPWNQFNASCVGSRPTPRGIGIFPTDRGICQRIPSGETPAVGYRSACDVRRLRGPGRSRSSPRADAAWRARSGLFLSGRRIHLGLLGDQEIPASAAPRQSRCARTGRSRKQ